MPRGSSTAFCLLLLMLASSFSFFAAAATSDTHLHTANPWLSSADVRSAVTGVTSCRRRNGSAHCPPPCRRMQQPTTNRSTSTQCLYYLQESHKEEVCGGDLSPARRRGVLHGLRMRHCCEHHVDGALPEAAFHDTNTCKTLLEALIQVDQVASRLSCSHADLLTRYDCAQNFSIATDCEDCKEAYRRWVCSSLVPHYTASGDRVRPCLSVCEDVEQRCPYLLPDQTILPGEAAHPTPQYAGEPTFLCLDPNIPETGEQRVNSARGDEDCCYTHCGSAGRGNVLGVCEHCPGRPPPQPLLAAPSRAAPRIFNKVLPLWTALVTFLLYSVRTFPTTDRRLSCS